ncbi:MAG: hypothetical protein V1897_19435 [Pseudomonadota bacterium]
MLEITDMLDPTSEMLALSTRGDTKNVLVCLIELSGPLHRETALEAARKAVEKFPQLTRKIREVRSKCFHYLVWDRRETLSVPVFSHEMPMSDASEPMLDQILKVLQDRLDREWNLFEEPPAEFHLIKISPKHHVAGWLMHHVAGDAATGTDVGQQTLFEYHKLRTGETPNWLQEYYSISGSRKRRVTPKKLTVRNLLKDVQQTFENLFLRASLPLGSGLKQDASQHHIKRILTEEETELLYKAGNNHGVSFVDRLVVSANDSIDEWNQKRGSTPGLLTTSMTVNMRGRFLENDSMNSSSLIFFKSFPSDRQDTKTFLRKVTLTRIRHFRNQTDLKLSKNIKMMNDLFRIFPFRIRRRIISHLVNRHQFSIATTVLGVVWPKIQNGRPTVESALTRIGDLDVLEVFGAPHKMLSKTPILLIIYVYRNKLNVVLTSLAGLFTKQESEHFLDLIMKNLMASQKFQIH